VAVQAYNLNCNATGTGTYELTLSGAATTAVLIEDDITL
jgi:hypothetical protein